MAKPDMRTRHAKAAQSYMQYKGYRDVQPTEVAAIEDDFCWYFYYELPEGYLELEVSWDAHKSEWNYAVTAFQVWVDGMQHAI